MTRRPAVTLIEALVAIFVMAIGLLALLTLFPLGAVSMAHALKDQRCAEASINATSLYKAFNLNNDTTDVVMPSGTATIFETPPATLGLPALATNSPTTYPVYLDPIGATAMNGYYSAGGTGTATRGGTALASAALGGTATASIPRATLTSPAGMPAGRTAQGWLTLLDDITYGDNGLPDATAGLQREGRYSWAYMVRRTSPYDSVDPLDVTVVVYAGRSPGADAGGNPLGETAYANATFGAGTNPNVVQIDWTTSTTKPAVRRGSWILDARMTPVPQGYFYRVVSVTDISATVMELEVQQPLGGQLRTSIPLGGTGTLIVMENVAEVFEKGINY
jgi:hypothetical protein